MQEEKARVQICHGKVPTVAVVGLGKIGLPLGREWTRSSSGPITQRIRNGILASSRIASWFWMDVGLCGVSRSNHVAWSTSIEVMDNKYADHANQSDRANQSKRPVVNGQKR